ILIQGQTGVGKELVARAIHAMSERSHKAFVPINCGAIAESLMESAIFGHEKGAFTGAIEVHQGVFERAEGGTLFLDEVDSLSPAAQTRLLRVIQENELERVGGKLAIHVDVRLISATNVVLLDKVGQGEFRKDLYYRVNVVNLEIPPLIERSEDLPALVDLILKRKSEKHNKSVNSVSSAVMQKIHAHQWLGNVRELENTLERSVLFTTGTVITELKLDAGESSSKTIDWKQQKEQALAKVEQAFLQVSLGQYHGDIKQIASCMEISTRAVYNKLKKYHINPAEYRK
ncbi:MAG: sigma-54-dependent Fis family transcriptional regulator, partial [Gammaproteobacteria bacterium]|nr:sigma-54-dependent Fis family transcriptional regulator [Gammaproteobacteria bacterium]